MNHSTRPKKPAPPELNGAYAIGIDGLRLIPANPIRDAGADQTGAAKRKTFVLVHGAWHGGWCWDYVRAFLEAEGHRVFTPTLTGLGERMHLLSKQVSLQTHIADIQNLIAFADLTDVILVGHSYGGMVITGVADAMKDRIAHIVYLDAGLPDDGDTFATLGADDPENAKVASDALRALSEDGMAMPPLPAIVFGIAAEDERNLAWVQGRLTAHPLATWMNPIALHNGGAEGLPRTFVHCVNPILPNTSFPATAARVSGDASWNYHELATGHDAMVIAPQAVAKILLSL